MGSTPRVQSPVIQAAPKVQDKAVQDALAAEVMRRSRARGFRSTILAKNFFSPESAALQDTLGS